MSGIAGVWYGDRRPVDRDLAERQAAIIAHRGADGCGIWSGDGVALVHRMLHNTPESLGEAYPVRGHGGDHVLVADLRLDNRDELIGSLGLRGEPSRIGDGELILHAYEKWGEDCAAHLLGDFAFALWDRTTRRLFCARDTAGVKPFFYHHGDGVFAFGSELKAILAVPGVPRRLNEDRIADYLVPMLEDQEITFYEGILRLPPAHTLTVDERGLTLRRYWSLDPKRDVRCASDAEYAEAFRSLFVDAVECRLRSAFPVGATLSGGLDSSSIACAAQQLLERQGRPALHTFSAVFDEVAECDERPFIRAVTESMPVQAHFVVADRLNPLGGLDRIWAHQDEAFYSANHYIDLGMYDAAREQGVRAFLEGYDGDTTVSHGVYYLAELARSGRWLALRREVNGLAENFGGPAKRFLWPCAIRPNVPEPVLRMARRARGRPTATGAALPALIDPEFARRRRVAERHRLVRADWLTPPRTQRQDHTRHLVWGLKTYALEVSDRAGASYGLEPRFPFFDRRLAEFCLGLPPDQIIHRGWTRLIMRRAMEGILPDAIRLRPGKADLSGAFNRGLLAYARPLLDAVIVGDPSHIAPYVDLPTLRAAYDRYTRGSARNSDIIDVWKSVTLALWLQHTERSGATSPMDDLPSHGPVAPGEALFSSTESPGRVTIIGEDRQ